MIAPISTHKVYWIFESRRNSLYVVFAACTHNKRVLIFCIVFITCKYLRPTWSWINIRTSGSNIFAPRCAHPWGFIRCCFSYVLQQAVSSITNESHGDQNDNKKKMKNALTRKIEQNIYETFLF